MKVIDKRLGGKEVPLSKVLEGEVFEIRSLSVDSSITYIKTDHMDNYGNRVCVSLASGIIYNLKEDVKVRPLAAQLTVSAKSDIE